MGLRHLVQSVPRSVDSVVALVSFRGDLEHVLFLQTVLLSFSHLAGHSGPGPLLELEAPPHTGSCQRKLLLYHVGRDEGAGPQPAWLLIPGLTLAPLLACDCGLSGTSNGSKAKGMS